MSERVEKFRQMLERKPDDARTLFGLALELEKEEQWPEVVHTLTRYLAVSDDEGNAWGRLGKALRMSGRDDDARSAYEKGIVAARSHGHPSMAADFEDILAEWDD